MSVDYYSCALCGECFADCSSRCCSCPDCGNMFCSTECANLKESENDSEDDACCICRKESANDYILYHALLRHFKLTEEQALKIWQDESDIDEEEEDNQ